MSRGLVGTLAAAVGATTVVALPSLLVGGLAVLVQEELRIGESALGSAIATAFAAAALVAIPAGHLAERIGPRRLTRVGLACGGLALVGIGWLASSWLTLAAFLALAGIGITSVQLGTNVLLSRAVPPERQGISFGAKQAAVPVASLLAGLALPIIGLRLGWQAPFLIAAFLVPLVAWRMPDAAPGRARREGKPPPVRVRSLLALTAGVALASAAGNSTPAFIVTSAVESGIPVESAGLVLAFGSLVVIGVRVAGGVVADAMKIEALVLVVTLIGLGVLGYVGLALADSPPLVILSAALAFGGGWGWGGLILLALSQAVPEGPGRAMGVVQIGPMTGAIVGPIVFGFTAEHVGFTAAWTVLATLAASGMVAILIARNQLGARAASGS